MLPASVKLQKKIEAMQNPHRAEHKLFLSKVAFKSTMDAVGIKTPVTYGFIEDDKDFDKLWGCQCDVSEFVFKPNHMGNGTCIYVVTKEKDEYRESDGTLIQQPYEYFKNITKVLLRFSNLRYKGVIIEQVIHTHPKLKEMYDVVKGIADIRLFMINDKYVFGRFRSPTKESRYYANWGRGGAIFHIDENGKICDGRNIFGNCSVEHPDTRKYMVGMKIPFWNKIIETGEKAAKTFKIPYHSVDMTVNEKGDVVVIEGESLPGLKMLTPYGVDWLYEKLNAKG